MALIMLHVCVTPACFKHAPARKSLKISRCERLLFFHMSTSSCISASRTALGTKIAEPSLGRTNLLSKDPALMACSRRCRRLVFCTSSSRHCIHNRSSRSSRSDSDTVIPCFSSSFSTVTMNFWKRRAYVSMICRHKRGDAARAAASGPGAPHIDGSRATLSSGTSAKAT